MKPVERKDQALRPEEELLLVCARTHMEEETAARLKAVLCRDVDWGRFVRLIERHSLVPLVHWHLKRDGAGLVPQPVLDDLAERFRINTLRNLRLTDDLLKILKLLDSNGVEAIPFKGPTLAISVYGNLALREFSDLDILVRPRSVTRAKELLISLGYSPEIELTGARAELFVESQYELLFRRDRDDMVELHWKLNPKYFSFPLDVENLWTGLEPVEIAGTRVMTLAREDLFLYLCAHGAKHFWERLEWICGISEMIRQTDASGWQRLMERAAELKSEKILRLGLLLAKELLGAHVPGDILKDALADRVVQQLAARVRSWLFTEHIYEPGVVELGMFYFRLNRRRRDAVRCALRSALAPNVEDLARWSLPRALFPVYLLLRPIRLVGKYGWSS